MASSAVVWAWVIEAVEIIAITNAGSLPGEHVGRLMAVLLVMHAGSSRVRKLELMRAEISPHCMW